MLPICIDDIRGLRQLPDGSIRLPRPRRPKEGKYHAKRTTVGGIEFASGLEARRYRQLRLAERNGVIRDLRVQVSYPLTVVDHPALRRLVTDALEEIQELFDCGASTERLYQESLALLNEIKDLLSGEQLGRYVADFAYTGPDGNEVVEDTKGYRGKQSPTYRLFKLKAQLVKQLYGVEVREVTSKEVDR